MRGIDERMREIKRRREIYRDMKALRRKIVADASACAAGAALMIAAICFLPRIREASRQTPVRQYGSMILEAPAIGYALVTLSAFILGAAFALLCRHLRQRRQRERDLE